MFGLYADELVSLGEHLMWLGAICLPLSVVVWRLWGIHLQDRAYKDQYGYDCLHPEKEPWEGLDEDEEEKADGRTPTAVKTEPAGAQAKLNKNSKAAQKTMTRKAGSRHEQRKRSKKH